MSEDHTPSKPDSHTKGLLGEDLLPERTGATARGFLNRHLGLFLALCLAVGLGCGALAVLVNSLNSEEPPFLDWSIGLYVIPPALLGWLAVRPWQATVGGSTSYLAAVLGDLAATTSTADDSKVLEYTAWFFVAFTLGALLGFLGHRIRSHATGTRAFATGFPLGLMALFLWMSIRAQAETGDRVVHPAVYFLEGILALVVLTLCRGWAARGAALLCAVALVIPFVFALIPLFLLVWFASGDY